MKKTITIYELLGLIKDNKAPKKIKVLNEVWYLTFKTTIQGSYDYVNADNDYLILEMLKTEYLTDVLKKDVEILDEEEFEDIEEIKFVDTFTDSYYDTCLIKMKDVVNQLINNQKKIIERLENEK